MSTVRSLSTLDVRTYAITGETLPKIADANTQKSHEIPHEATATIRGIFGGLSSLCRYTELAELCFP